MKILDTDILNSKVLKALIKGSLVLIGLFAVLYCGIVALVLRFADKLNCMIFALIIILVSLPIIVFLIVFFGISYFVKKKSQKSAGNEVAPFKQYRIKVISEVCHKLLDVIKPSPEKNKEALPELLKEMVELLSKMSSEEEENGSDGNKKLTIPK